MEHNQDSKRAHDYWIEEWPPVPYVLPTYLCATYTTSPPTTRPCAPAETRRPERALLIAKDTSTELAPRAASIPRSLHTDKQI